MNKLVIEGLVATTPRMVITEEGTKVFTFRLANSPEGKDRINWLTATAYGAPAVKMQEKIQKGTVVQLWGDLAVRDWDNGERSGTSVEIEVYSFFVASNPKIAHSCNCEHCEDK
jgi:single-strand DNA-binding protein